MKEMKKEKYLRKNIFIERLEKKCIFIKRKEINMKKEKEKNLKKKGKKYITQKILQIKTLIFLKKTNIF